MPARPVRTEQPKPVGLRILTISVAGLVLTGVVALTAPGVVAGLGGGTTAAAASTTSVTASATITSTAADGGSVVATFVPTGFRTSDGQLSVSGTLTGVVANGRGIRTPLDQTATTMVTSATTDGSCRTLSLQLRPLRPDLLGGVVDLDEVDLEVTASGPGDPLGDLPCAVADLLTRGDLAGLATMLNLVLEL